ncbi:DNA binding domain, excisionase family (plasmid) [Legionella adelaidensis]|uniref:DNA binding domain, excisionase family n=1 Tax=Legionella adelaidensis TaxID=45056 RepID=A0A0W0R1T0_9GAMM|nr:excisionase family DNA-binding protein [Legionella adelaidensis]KTC65057.1 Helix-turn-helix domain protein [Legionella adelaidensis]VEH85423.1 DNA binding domain, excisionase family [Legionella adelaidensis]
MLSPHNFELSIPSKHDREIAKTSVNAIEKAHLDMKKAKLLIQDMQVELPLSAVKLLLEALGQLAQGNALTMIPRHAALTTQEAADLLNVSRPYFIKLLDSGQIPFSRTGNRRKVLAKDLFKFKDESSKKQNHAIDELVKQAQDFGMDYDE